ncbi:hypothetical protein JWG44_15320 [Leptospira sp. 201903071]|uniref:hypothetical protein n=1 Tax=Leptospira ainazelensis TaxID=2810034 RepID=UPI001966127F|nr:hypothetical protein [Leptospira ainazelensis]MBM9501623.1 hypothetical protein [Leptospira ainazelensis]
MINPEDIIQFTFSQGAEVRYVAIRWNGIITKKQRSGVENSSSSDSDYYEEQIVNPALLLLAKQRGDIDCGGLDHIIVSYGNFFQIVAHLANGHISICIEKHAFPEEFAKRTFPAFKERFPDLYRNQ